MLPNTEVKDFMFRLRLSSDEAEGLAELARVAGTSRSKVLRGLSRKKRHKSQKLATSNDFRRHLAYALALVIMVHDEATTEQRGDVEKLSNMILVCLEDLV